MPWPPKTRLRSSACSSCWPSAPAPPPRSDSGSRQDRGRPPGRLRPRLCPDYGGRDAPLMPSDAAGTALPNPLAQAGRALEALVIVLVGVVGVLYLLKRAGVTGGRSGSARLGGRGESAVSAAKPRRRARHVRRRLAVLADRRAVADPARRGRRDPAPALGQRRDPAAPRRDPAGRLPARPVGRRRRRRTRRKTPKAEKAAFDEYLRCAGVGAGPSPARAVEERIGATADRLQSLLARSRARTSEETPDETLPRLRPCSLLGLSGARRRRARAERAAA